MDLEPSLREIAADVVRRAEGRRPALFEPRDWLRRMIERSLDDEGLRTALFRFVDVLPSLGSTREIGEHLEEYLGRVDHALGSLALLAATLHAGWAVAPLVRKNVVSLARRFIAEEERSRLFAVVERLRREGSAVTLDLVGEAVVSAAEAAAQLERYEHLLGDASERAAGWADDARLDRDERGQIPRVQLSVKLSSLYARFDALDPDAERVAGKRLRRLARTAARARAAITVDMESRDLKEATLAVFRSLLEEEELGGAPALGIVLQAYLPETEDDLDRLLELARARRRRIGVRLVKGAYWDSELARASQRGWPSPVFTDKAETDAAYERLTRLLLESRDVVDAAFASHNLRSLCHAMACARVLGLPPGAYEIQMLYGMAEPLRQALVERGERVRVYLPIGDLVPGMAYLVRRLLENTSNVSFLRQSYADGESLDALLAQPRERRGHSSFSAAIGESDRGGGKRGMSPFFANEPPRDFSREAVREDFAAALDTAHAAGGRYHPLAIAGERVTTRAELVSCNPAMPSEVIGKVAIAGPEEVDRAVSACAEAFAGWSRTTVAERAAIAGRAAEEMRSRRDELSARIVLEVGKGWRDADAEICEAIDYLEYYAREAVALAEPRPTDRVLGEQSELRCEPLGVAAVVAPWNFPLAIPTGMLAAALLAGNTAVLKPAEQSPVLGAELYEIWRRAGLPLGACALLQGGGEVGAALVADPRVAVVAFTGSRTVGLEILRSAAVTSQRTVKRVVCEMGGKNAIVVDGDADQDEAILAVLESAFGYQGQKCSAASRLIVVGETCEPLLRRLVEAARGLRVGPPEDPRNDLGPLIDEEALDRVVAAIGRAQTEGKLLVGEPAPSASRGEGYFVGPAIASELSPEHRLAQEEIFGPLLLVFAAESFEAAIELANATPYGLTGGVFSRSPAHLEYARHEFRAGNLYLNRGITGAVVRRHPFGGIKLSGAGWKAGGPDYLRQFLLSRTIAENTLRHGFAPEVEGAKRFPGA